MKKSHSPPGKSIENAQKRAKPCKKAHRFVTKSTLLKNVTLKGAPHEGLAVDFVDRATLELALVRFESGVDN